MGLTVRKLNGDTTFLLSFGVENINGHITQNKSDTVRILIDPWLRGDSSWLHPSFQFSQRTISSVVDSLAQIVDDIDLIIISQDKPDHCHKETLCSWPRERRTKILATPAAARKIRDWKHFPSDCIHELGAYSPGDQSTLTRIALPTGPRDVKPAELTVANITSRKDLTGLHNAIGIVYRPSLHMARRDSSTDGAPSFTPPRTPQSPMFLQPDGGSISSETRTLRSRIRSYRSLRHLSQHYNRPQIATPPQTSDGQVCLSCIYTPHGVSKNLLESYLQSHLSPMGALPLTVLVHSIVQERNPWYMGGVVAAGMPGGISIVKALDGQVRAWISAHDELKDNRGLSVKLLKSERYGEDEVKSLLRESGYLGVDLLCPLPGKTIYFAG